MQQPTVLTRNSGIMRKILENYVQHFCTQFLQIMRELCMAFAWLFVTLLVNIH